MSGQGDQLRVAMIGYGFMGAAHTHAWQAARRAFDLKVVPTLSVLCGRDQEQLRAAAARYGFAETATDWRDVIARDDIDVVDICTPGDTHMPIAVAALEAGKHVLCEKPLANSVAEAEAMTSAAEVARAGGRRSMVAFNYRRVPALVLAHQLVAEGRLGELRHVRGAYLQDWLVDPAVPLAWRMRRESAGSGALGDIGAHVLDLAQYLTGEKVSALSAQTRTFITERPLPSGPTVSLGGRGGSTVGEVTVDDAVVMHADLGPALATFEATRMATGRKNALRIELNGSKGSLSFDFEAMNERLGSSRDGRRGPARELSHRQERQPAAGRSGPCGRVGRHPHSGRSRQNAAPASEGSLPRPRVPRPIVGLHARAMGRRSPWYRWRYSPANGYPRFGAGK